MTPGANNTLMQTTATAPSDNATATMPMVNTNMPPAHNQGQMPQMDPQQMNIDQMNSNHQEAMTAGQLTNMGHSANGSGHSNMNSNMNQGGGSHTNSGMGSHK